MKIERVNVFGLEDTIEASGLPLSDDPTYSVERAKKLGSSKAGSGHDCYLKGIIVQYWLTADHTFWLHFLRYHFHDIVSSTSKMHCITKMDKSYNKFVLKASKDNVDSLIKAYNDANTYPIMIDDVVIKSKSEMFECVVMNAPLGLELKAKVTDNYLQCKTKHIQRRGHKLSPWQEYCDWLETLPKFKELALGIKE